MRCKGPDLPAASGGPSEALHLRAGGNQGRLLSTALHCWQDPVRASCCRSLWRARYARQVLAHPWITAAGTRAEPLPAARERMQASKSRKGRTPLLERVASALADAAAEEAAASSGDGLLPQCAAAAAGNTAGSSHGHHVPVAPTTLAAAKLSEMTTAMSGCKEQLPGMAPAGPEPQPVLLAELAHGAINDTFTSPSI